MRRHVVLTKSIEKKITEDWQREIPSLGIYKTRWLLRRVGPLLVGICLDRDSGGDIYKPCFHVHFLGKVFPCVSLTLNTQLRSERSGGPNYIEVKWHAEKYKEAAARMVQQSLLPLEGDLQLEDVIDAYEHYMSTPMGRHTPVLEYQDMILLHAWAFDQQGALKFLTKCLQIDNAPSEVSFKRLQNGKLVTKSIQIIQDPNFQHVGGRAVFESECRKLIEKPDLIQHTVDSQIKALKADKLPVANLLK